MEAEGLVGDLLLRELGDTRRRFQTRMQRLMEKYNQPFEDDALVQMATLTYETPQGLRIWGGRLIKERSEEQSQDPSVKAIEELNDPGQATEGHACTLHCTQVLGAGTKSSVVGATSDKEDSSAYALKPAVPGSPLKNELRRKYLTQVDVVLQDAAEYVKGVEKRGGEDTLVTQVPSLSSTATPPPACQGRVSADDLEVLAASPREWSPSHPCPANMITTPRSDSLSFLGTSSDSYLSSQSLEADDICNVTISDLYAGMLHSMSRLLSSQPSCIISTKTYIGRNWNPRRRLPHRIRVQRSSRQGSAPSSEPGVEIGMLGDCKNVNVHHKTGLKLETPFLEGSKLQMRKFNPAWKKFQMVPWEHSSLTSLDFNTMCHLDREDRLKSLKWLVSPIKGVSRPRMLQGRAESWYREIDIKFEKLHQECSQSSRKQPHLTGPSKSQAVDVYRDGSRSPGSPQGLGTYRLSLALNGEKAKRLSKAFQYLGKTSVKAGSHPAKRDPSSFPSESEDSPTQSPGRSGPTSGIFLQGHNSGTVRKAVSPSTAISAPWMGPQDCGRSRYDEIKEEFQKLYQKYCLMSPRQVKVPLRVRVPPSKATAGVRGQTKDSLGKLNLDSRFQHPQKLSPSPQWHTKGTRDSTAMEGHASLETISVATRNPLFPSKRRRLSYPQVCGHQASQDSAEGVSKAMPCPEEQVVPAQPHWLRT